MLTKKLKYLPSPLPLLAYFPLSLLVSLAILASYASPAHAQDTLLLRDYHYVKQQDIWLTTSNPAALTRYQRQRIAEADIQLSYQNGGLCNYFEASRALQATANIEAIQRISSRVVVAGAMSYDNYSGRHMTGSAFMHLSPLASCSLPLASHLPFDIVEDSLTNPGTKHRDTYHLLGGMGIELGKGYAVGVRIDYTAANYAKYKDLRHKNKLMDLQATASVYAPVAKWLNIGAGYTYHRQTESVTFSTYGNTDKVYKSLIDYGVFSGRIEQFGEEGFTDKNREMPLFEDSHGADLQIEVLPMQQLSVMAGFGISAGDGYYGRKSPSTITYTNHSRDVVRANAAVTYTLPRQLHRLAFNYQLDKVKNNRNAYREVSNDQGAYHYEYFGDVRMGNRQWMDADISYTAFLGLHHELPIWQLSLSSHFTERLLIAYQHPFKRKQKLNTTALTLQATRNILLSQGVLSATAHIDYQKGRGEPYTDLVEAVPSDKQLPPPTMEAFLYREYQYLTVPQYQLGAAVKYAFIMPKTRLKMHAKISGDYRKATETYAYSTGNHHLSTAIAIGCTF